MIPCGGSENNSCERCYIGETGRDLFLDRIPEHKRKYKNSQTRLINHGIDACLSHAIRMKHTFDFDKTKVIEMSKKNNVRKDLEAIHIHLNRKKAVNFKTDTQHLDTTTKGVVRIFEKYTSK